jgi:hypothetical protein
MGFHPTDQHTVPGPSTWAVHVGRFDTAEAGLKGILGSPIGICDITWEIYTR